jgi:hypothetical protein
MTGYIKDSLKEDVKFFDGGWIDWLAACEGTAAEWHFCC